MTKASRNRRLFNRWVNRMRRFNMLVSVMDSYINRRVKGVIKPLDGDISKYVDEHFWELI